MTSKIWKYNFCTFRQTVITRMNFLKIFPWRHVDSWPKSLLLRTHHLWNSTTELILIYKHLKITYKVIRIVGSPARVFPMFPFHTPWAHKIAEFLTFINWTVWTVTTGAEFELTVKGRLISESFFTLTPIFQKSVKSLPWEDFL